MDSSIAQASLSQPTGNSIAQSPSLEEKLYVILRSIEPDVIEEYLESFGIKKENLPIGLKLKEAADSMPKAQFVNDIRSGILPFAAFSPIEIEVLHRGAHMCGNIDAECPMASSAIRF